jgi:hypothetical protein
MRISQEGVRVGSVQDGVIVKFGPGWTQAREESKIRHVDELEVFSICKTYGETRHRVE